MLLSVHLEPGAWRHMWDTVSFYYEHRMAMQINNALASHVAYMNDHLRGSYSTCMNETCHMTGPGIPGPVVILRFSGNSTN